MSKIEAVIFDMDGVISDTQTICSNVESNLLMCHGIHITPAEITRRFSGRVSREFFAELFSEAGKSTEGLAELIEERRQKVFDAAKGHIQPIPGALELIDSLHSQGIPLAVASSSRLKFVNMVLGELKILHLFKVITSGEEVTRSKPEPDVFLLAAKRLGVQPEKCIVIEDGLSGMVAAKAAGMKCIGLVSENDDRKFPADYLFSSLSDIKIEFILEEH